MTTPATAPQPGDPECDGLCVSAADIGVGRADQIAYPHPSCPLHAPGEVCKCGQPDRCQSPTHHPAWVERHSEGATRALKDLPGPRHPLDALVAEHSRRWSPTDPYSERRREPGHRHERRPE